MKKGILSFITVACVLITGCGSMGSLSTLPSPSPGEEKQKLTILHIDAEKKGFQEFIKQAEEKLNMEITVEKCPDNADNRQAKISTILASGDNYEGSTDYAKLMKSYPARLDVIENEDIDLEEIDMVREYLKEYTLNARPLCENSIEAISEMEHCFRNMCLDNVKRTVSLKRHKTV